MCGLAGIVLGNAEKTGANIRIFIGQTSETKRIPKGFDWKRLSADGIIINSRGRDPKSANVDSIYVDRVFLRRNKSI